MRGQKEQKVHDQAHRQRPRATRVQQAFGYDPRPTSGGNEESPQGKGRRKQPNSQSMFPSHGDWTSPHASWDSAQNASSVYEPTNGPSTATLPANRQEPRYLSTTTPTAPCVSSTHRPPTIRQLRRDAGLDNWKPKLQSTPATTTNPPFTGVRITSRLHLSPSDEHPGMWDICGKESHLSGLATPGELLALAHLILQNFQE